MLVDDLGAHRHRLVSRALQVPHRLVEKSGRPRVIVVVDTQVGRFAGGHAGVHRRFATLGVGIMYDLDPAVRTVRELLGHGLDGSLLSRVVNDHDDEV